MSGTPGADISFDISVLIVSFNTRDVLRECMQSVRRESESLRTQVIVVDNGSVDGSQLMVEREFPEALLIRSAVNLGFAGANNLGYRSATGRYLVLLNSDAFLAEGALLRSVRHMEETLRCGIGGGRLVGRDGSWQPSARRFPSLLDDVMVRSGLAARFPRSRFFGRFDRTWADAMEAAEVDWVPGAFSIVRGAILEKTELFDPRFFLYYEEVDLCMRMKQMGYSVWYWPDICVTHLGGESSRKISSLEMSKSGSQLTLWRMRSTLLYYRKHCGRLTAATAMILERFWYWQRFVRMRISRDPRRRETAASEKRLAAIMNQAWRETGGGKLSPVQPW
jgi:GT2 family glycosyltransferase